MTKIALDAKALSDLAIEALQDIKARNMLRMDLRQADGSITDYFVICSGTSDKHVQALADSVMKEAKAVGERPISIEGMDTGSWVLLDFVNVVVHIFQQQSRDFYRLESLWGDAETERFEDVT